MKLLRRSQIPERVAVIVPPDEVWDSVDRTPTAIATARLRNRAISANGAASVPIAEFATADAPSAPDRQQPEAEHTEPVAAEPELAAAAASAAAEVIEPVAVEAKAEAKPIAPRKRKRRRGRGRARKSAPAAKAEQPQRPPQPEAQQPEAEQPETEQQPQQPEAEQPEAEQQPQQPEAEQPEAEQQPQQPEAEQPEAEQQPQQPEAEQPEAAQPQPQQPEAEEAAVEQQQQPEAEQPEAERQSQEPERELAPDGTNLLASLVKSSGVGTPANVRVESARTAVELFRAEPEEPLALAAEQEPPAAEETAPTAEPVAARAKEPAQPDDDVRLDEPLGATEDSPEEREPVPDLEVCDIAIWKGYRKARFYARVVGADGAEFALAESTAFRWRGNGSLEQTADAAVAHKELLDYLVNHGWKVASEAPAWYAKTLRRS